MLSRGLLFRSSLRPVFRWALKPAVAARPGCLPHNYSTDASTPVVLSKASKALNASPLVPPKEIPVIQKPHVPQEDIDDFNITKLTHGKTELRIAITLRARDKLEQIARDDNNPDSALRIKVESGGCHGFQYNLDLTEVSKELKEDDELLVFLRDGVATVIFDESSLEILQDSKVDYTKELIGLSFKVVDSPYTSTACGCGASFDFDFDKLEEAKSQRAK